MRILEERVCQQCQHREVVEPTLSRLDGWAIVRRSDGTAGKMCPGCAERFVSGPPQHVKAITQMIQRQYEERR